MLQCYCNSMWYRIESNIFIEIKYDIILYLNYHLQNQIVIHSDFYRLKQKSPKSRCNNILFEFFNFPRVLNPDQFSIELRSHNVLLLFQYPFSNRGNKREFPGHQNPGGRIRWHLQEGSVPGDYLLGQGYSLTRHGFHSP